MAEVSKAADLVAEMTAIRDHLELAEKVYRCQVDTHGWAETYTKDVTILLRRLGASGVDVEGLARELYEKAYIPNDIDTGDFDMREAAIIIRKHIAQPAARQKDLELAAELLEEMYDKWENGDPATTEDGDSLGNAFQLGDREDVIIDVLNRLFPPERERRDV